VAIAQRQRLHQARYPWIAEAALKNGQKHFVIDGEVGLGVDSISDFNALHSRKHDDEVQLYVVNILAMGGDDLRSPPLHMRKANLEQLLACRPDTIIASDLAKASELVKPERICDNRHCTRRGLGEAFRCRL
jgi:ATP-dependent DNA ligase